MSRMKRKRVHLLSSGGDPAVGDRAEPREQIESPIDRLVRRPLEPLERSRVPAPGEDVEKRAGQIDAPDLWLAVIEELLPFVPEARRPSGRRPSRAARPLVGGIARDPLRLEPVDADGGIVTNHLVQAAVDDLGDSLRP
jgi:hypothetical protein